MTTAPAPAAQLADTLNARLLHNAGDPRIIASTDLIYGSFVGKVRLDHRGRITDLGTWNDGADVLAARYREVVGEVAS